VLNPLKMTGADKLVFQTVGETRLVVDSKVKPVALVGQVKMTLVALVGGLMGRRLIASRSKLHAVYSVQLRRYRALGMKYRMTSSANQTSRG